MATVEARMRRRRGFVQVVVLGLVGIFGLGAVGGSARAEAFREGPPCPVFTKQVPVTHTWEDDKRAQWSCRYLLTIIASGLRDAKGNCIIKHVETERMCVGVQPDSGVPSV